MSAFRGTRVVTPADSCTAVIEMQSLSGELRNRLVAAVKAARRAGEAGARSVLAVLAVGDARAHPSLSPDEQDLRRRLRAHGRQLGDRLDAETGVQQVERLAHEVAYEHWHRMLFARFLAENDLLIEPESGVAVSLTDCEELARERGQDCWTVAGRFAERMLPRIFRSDDPALAVPLAPETRQTLERLHALVNYHRLAGADGEGRRMLDALTCRHLGEWIARQRSDRDQGVDGADGRLVAAEDLQNQLTKIMTGEPPCDLFVRWKPLGEQPIGWEPDIHDSMRVNIRPFMWAELTRGGRAGAGLLRVKPKIAWSKDQGKEALKRRKRWRPPWAEDDDNVDVEIDEDRELRPREDYPWFWGCRGDGSRAERTGFRGGPEFDGNRWIDLHHTNDAKRAARARRMAEVGS